jgi:hypothetical protein
MPDYCGSNYLTLAKQKKLERRISTMYIIGDYVQHQKTGNVGEVVGYGHQIVEDVYLTTIKVRLLKGKDQKSIVEDVLSEWTPLEKEPTSQSFVQ